MSNCNGRIYKGTPYEITVPIIYGEIDNFLLRFFTDGNNYADLTIEDVKISGDTVYVEIGEHTFDLLNEGVLRYDLKYEIDEVNYHTVANTMLYLKSVCYSGHTAEDYYQSGYTAGVIDGQSGGFQSGYTAGIDAQKALIEQIEITENGTYRSDNGYSPVVVNIPQSGHTDEELAAAYDNGYVVGEAAGEIAGAASQKALMIQLTATTNGTYTREDGYSSINVNVAQTGHTDAEITEAFNSGYTGGEIAGAAEQKALMIPFTATTNGTYAREDGYSSFEVVVPQTGHTDAELQQAFQSGYTGGESAQKSKLSAITITQNGPYTRADGYSAITVSVPQTGHTDAEITEAYNSGYTAGMAAQKALMVGLTATTNGTYTREDGYSSVYVNVSGSSSGSSSGVSVDYVYVDARDVSDTYINTGIYPTTNTSFRLKYVPIEPNGGCIVGFDSTETPLHSSSDYNDYRYINYSGIYRGVFDFNSSRLEHGAISLSENNLADVSFGNYYIENKYTTARVTGTTNSSISSPNIPIYLNLSNRERIQSLEIYQGGVLVFNGHAALKDGVYGIWDSVSERLLQPESQTLTVLGGNFE